MKRCELPRRSALLVVRPLFRCYKLLLSPLLGARCRFDPSCSDYAIEAIEKRGVVVGTLLAVRRVLRCHPFTEGGFDPVPEARPRSTDTRR